MTQHMGELMQKEVSRKEFLTLSGLAVASVFGFGGVIKLLTGKSLHTSLSGHASGVGYGSSAYGGNKPGL
jgi:hypothetical protein